MSLNPFYGSLIIITTLILFISSELLTSKQDGKNKNRIKDIGIVIGILILLAQII